MSSGGYAFINLFGLTTYDCRWCALAALERVVTIRVRVHSLTLIRSAFFEGSLARGLPLPLVRAGKPLGWDASPHVSQV